MRARGNKAPTACVCVCPAGGLAWLWAGQRWQQELELAGEAKSARNPGDIRRRQSPAGECAPGPVRPALHAGWLARLRSVPDGFPACAGSWVSTAARSGAGSRTTRRSAVPLPRLPGRRVVPRRDRGQDVVGCVRGGRRRRRGRKKKTSLRTVIIYHQSARLDSS